MKTHFLFPNQLKKFGWILFIPCFIITILQSIFEWNIDEYFNTTVFAIYNDEFNFQNTSHFFQFIENSILDEILSLGLIIGGLLVGFSKLKNEDEYIAQIRYESLVWATYLNYGLILFFTLFIYGLSFINVLMYNLFTLLVFFIIRFHFMIYKLNKASNDEE